MTTTTIEPVHVVLPVAVPGEIPERPVPAVIDFWNVERPAHGNTVFVLADFRFAEIRTPLVHAPTGCVNPPGPAHGNARVMRGGSYLCHHSYCNRYRVAARTGNSPDAASGNLSFRCARDMPPT